MSRYRLRLPERGLQRQAVPQSDPGWEVSAESDRRKRLFLYTNIWNERSVLRWKMHKHVRNADHVHRHDQPARLGIVRHLDPRFAWVTAHTFCCLSRFFSRLHLILCIWLKWLLVAPPCPTKYLLSLRHSQPQLVINSYSYCFRRSHTSAWPNLAPDFRW